MKQHFEVVIIGAGAAGLMCAIEAGKRGRSVAVLEGNPLIGEKIRISGGGRCNFTNTGADHSQFVSQNPDFCRSALARFAPSHFIALVERHGIAYHEKKLGQLFCDNSSSDILSLLLQECAVASVNIITDCRVRDVHRGSTFTAQTNHGTVSGDTLVVASGGLSIPKLGASDIGYRIARSFGLRLTEVKPGLVPLTFTSPALKPFLELSGLSIDAIVECRNVRFRENILFTHRGLSGPAILQASSYWSPGVPITIDLLPGQVEELTEDPLGEELLSHLQRFLPKRFVRMWCDQFEPSRPLSSYSKVEKEKLLQCLHNWEIVPDGTEGFGKAEVTVGGVDTRDLSSKTMEARNVPGLFVIGEVVDVTGWLGGYNFQWAWASGWVAGQYV